MTYGRCTVSARLVTFAVVLCASLMTTAAPAAAHANLVGSTPGSGVVVESGPSEVVLRFDEAVAVDLGSGMRVFGPAGGRVDRGRTTVRDDGLTVAAPVDANSPGTYTVAWRVVSEDSHVLSGSLLFHVQRETGAAPLDDGAKSTRDALGWLARWWIVLAMTVIGGLLTMRELRSGGSPAARARGVVVGLAALGVFGALLRFEVQVVGASGRSYASALSLWGDAIESTRAGRLDAARVAAALVVLVGGLGWRRRWGVVTAGLGIAVTVVVNALEGHAWSANVRAIATVADVVHQVAASVWVGGLVALMLVGATQRREAAARFSQRAAIALAAVALTGLIATVVQFGTSLDGLDVAYGRVLAVKVLFVAAMAVLGWQSRSILQRAGQRRELLQRTVLGEIGAAVVVLGLTAALVGMVPARSLSGGGALNATAEDGHGPVSITVDPARPGENAMHLYFFDAQQRPRMIDAVEVQVAIADVPARVIDVEPVTQGHFVAGSFSLPTRGRWTFSVVSVTRGEVAKFSIEVKVS